MKLAAKVILIYLLGVLGVVGVSAWLSIRQHRAWEQDRREMHAKQVADAITGFIEKAYEGGATITAAQAVEVYSHTTDGSQVNLVEGDPPDAPASAMTARGVFSVSVTNADGTRTAHAYVPLRIDGQDAGTLQVSHPLDDHDAYISRSIVGSLVTLATVTLLSGLVIYFAGIRLIGRPLAKLTEQVNAIGHGELDQQPALTGNDEFGRLAHSISAMSQHLREQRDTIRHVDRLGTLGVLSAGIAHELGTPLNVVSGQAGLIAGGRLTPEEVKRSASTIKQEADRITGIIRQLLDFARHKPSPGQPVDLYDLVRRTCGLMNALAHKRSISIQPDLPDEHPHVLGDPSQLQQVFSNLLSNAIDAMPDGGVIHVSASTDPDKQAVVVEVSDSGKGIQKQTLPHIFEPFFTTKDVGEGTGLGLSIAYGIVAEHGGQITVSSRPGAGATFRVTLPVVDPQQAGP